MPSWNIHLSISKRLSNIYKVNKNTFAFASLIPDYKKELRHDTHFYGNEKYAGYNKAYIIDYEHFKEVYKDNLSNSLILGYYAHILADYFYNTRFFLDKVMHDENGNVIGIKDKGNTPYESIRDIKHDDLENYGSYLYNIDEVIIPELEEDILNCIKLLIPNFLDSDFVIDRINYLNNEFIKEYCNRFSNNYYLYTKEEYDNLYNECIEFIIKEFDKINVEKY